MKIMKRNGSEAAFDREKIAAAVTKANLATDQPPELSGGQVAQLAPQRGAGRRPDGPHPVRGGDSGAGGDRDYAPGRL